jgi:hypothetical protein
MDPVKAMRVDRKEPSVQIVEAWAGSALAAKFARARRSIENVHFGTDAAESAGLSLHSVANARPVVWRIVGGKQH